MAITAYFRPTNFTPERYDEVIRQLEAAGAGAPAGRTYHVAFEAGNGIHVFDVWDSQADLDAFGATLMPILGGLGVDPGQPLIASVRNVIEG